MGRRTVGQVPGTLVGNSAITGLVRLLDKRLEVTYSYGTGELSGQEQVVRTQVERAGRPDVSVLCNPGRITTF